MVPLVFINAKYLKNDALAYTVLEVFSHLNKFSIVSFKFSYFFNVGYLLVDCSQIVVLGFFFYYYKYLYYKYLCNTV